MFRSSSVLALFDKFSKNIVTNTIHAIENSIKSIMAVTYGLQILTKAMTDISWIKEKSNKRKWIEVDPVETPGLSVENFQILDVQNEASAGSNFQKTSANYVGTRT